MKAEVEHLNTFTVSFDEILEALAIHKIHETDEVLMHANNADHVITLTIKGKRHEMDW